MTNERGLHFEDKRGLTQKVQIENVPSSVAAIPSDQSDKPHLSSRLRKQCGIRTAANVISADVRPNSNTHPVHRLDNIDRRAAKRAMQHELTGDDVYNLS